jgi:hypothetical protein
MRKQLLMLAGAALGVLALSTNAYADTYEGGWRFTQNTLILGDNSDGTGLFFRYTDDYCGRPASRGWESIKEMLRDDKRYGDGQITWYVDEECYGTTRVCITTSIGERGCNTFRGEAELDDWI